MRKIVIHCLTDKCGTDFWEFVEVGEDYTIEELDTIAHEYALRNAEVHGMYPPCDGDSCWYDYVPEKHDMYTTGGGKPKWD